jgi:tetratricopeptide (TPR) repeat protein
MTLNKLLLLSLVIVLLNSCNDSKKATINDEQNKSIPSDYFKDEKAANLNEKGIELSKSGNYEEGKEVFLRALELEPNNPTTLSNLGLNRFLDYDYHNAIEYYQKSYKISDSTYHIAAINLGLTYFYNEEFDKGIEITNFVIESTNDKDILSSAYVHRALNYLGNDECEKAQTDLNYISGNFLGIGNTDYHIKDLTEKIKSCIQYRK